MPRHQDNVGVVLTSNPRPNRTFSGVYTLDVRGIDPNATHWEEKFDDYGEQLFRCETVSGDLYVRATMSTNGKLSVGNLDPWGHLRYINVPTSPEASFSWSSSSGHRITLALAAATKGGFSKIVCRDPNPSTLVWEFDLLLGDDELGLYTVDYRGTDSSKGSGVASFTVHQSYSRS